MLEPQSHYSIQLLLRYHLKGKHALNIDRQYEFHCIQVMDYILRTELVLLLNSLVQSLVVYQRQLNLLEKGRVVGRSILYSEIDSFDDELQYLFGFNFGEINEGKVHSAFYSLLQGVKEGDFPGSDDEGDVLFDISVVEPLEYAVEYTLLAVLLAKDLGVLYYYDQFFALHQLELFVESVQIYLGLVYYYVLADCALSQEFPQLSGELVQKLTISLVDAAVDGDDLGLNAFLSKVFGEPNDMAILPTLLRPYQYEAVPNQVITVLAELVAQGDYDLWISIVFAHVFDELVQHILVDVLPHVLVRR